MTKVKAATAITAILFLTAALAIGARSMMLGQVLGHFQGKDKVLYVWAQDQAHVAPDFLAVINFDEESSQYGTVIRTVPVPPPGNVDNEPHHCHLNSSKTILGCGGLLSVLKGQNGIFFFDVTNATQPRFLFSTKALESSITDDFLPIENGGFLITQMGAADGSAPGRIAEFDGGLHFVANHFGIITTTLFQEWPATPPLDGFNPHGISSRPDLNLMMTSDFILPTSTLVGSPGPVLRGSVRIWDYRRRTITKTIQVISPDGGPALGTMDVKMLPKDRHGYGYIAGMFDGHIYLIDPIGGHGCGGVRLRDSNPSCRHTGDRRNGTAPRDSAERRPADFRSIPGRAGRPARHHGPLQFETVVRCQLWKGHRTSQPRTEQ